MNRRDFMKRMLFNFQAAMMAGMLPRAIWAAADPSVYDNGNLPYRPLNGQSLREIAARRGHHGNGRFINPMGIPRKGRYWQLLSWKLNTR